MDSAVHVPLERVELNRSLQVVNNVSVAEGGKVKTVAVNKLKLSVLVVFVSDKFVTSHESRFKCVEVDHRVGQDAEFLVGSGVERHATELAEAER